MRGLLKLIGILMTLLLVAGAGIYFTGNTMNVAISFLKPGHDFDLSKKVAAPDYSDSANWAALPDTNDLADLVPDGVAKRTDAPIAEVFFIHPTGYLHGGDWNSPMDPMSRTEENTKWMMANQAATFNSCCEVWAPRYREASIFAYMAGDIEMMNKALDFAYEDVERAFDHFLANRDPSMPFIIASHSQGTHHGATLLKRRIAGSPLRDQMVAAYIIGGGTSLSDVAQMSDIEPCDSPVALHCIIHWATYGDGGDAGQNDWNEDGSQVVCTNPLSWKNDGQRVEADHHRGAVNSSGTFSIEFWKKDVAAGTAFHRQPAPLPNLTWAECQNGFLIVSDQAEGPMGAMANMPGKNYHGLDYPLFHMDIRQNTVDRTKAWHETDTNVLKATLGPE